MAIPITVYTRSERLSEAIVRGETVVTPRNFPEVSLTDIRDLELRFTDGTAFEDWSGDAGVTPEVAIGECGSPSSGDWTLEGGGGNLSLTQTTLSATATPQQVEDAIVANSSAGADDVRVTGAVGFYRIEFIGALADTDIDPLTAADMNLDPRSSVSVTEITEGGTGDNAVQTVNLAIQPLAYQDSWTPNASGDGWTGTLKLDGVALKAAQKQAGSKTITRDLVIRVTDADGNPTVYARRSVTIYCDLIPADAFTGEALPNALNVNTGDNRYQRKNAIDVRAYEDSKDGDDWAPAIQAAIDAAVTAGVRDVVIPPSDTDYLVEDRILIDDDNLRLWMWGAKLKTDDAADWTTFALDAHANIPDKKAVIVVSGATNVRIFGGEINGTDIVHESEKDACGVLFHDCDRCKIVDTSVINFNPDVVGQDDFGGFDDNGVQIRYNGILFMKSRHCLAERCYAENIKYDAMTARVANDDITFLNCHSKTAWEGFQSTVRYGSQLPDAPADQFNRHIWVTRCTAEDTKGVGIVTHSQFVTITDCLIDTFAEYGFQTRANSNNVTLRGTTFRNPTGTSKWMVEENSSDAGSTFKVLDCTFDGGTSDMNRAIFLLSDINYIIRGNTFVGQFEGLIEARGGWIVFDANSADATVSNTAIWMVQIGVSNFPKQFHITNSVRFKTGVGTALRFNVDVGTPESDVLIDGNHFETGDNGITIQVKGARITNNRIRKEGGGGAVGLNLDRLSAGDVRAIAENNDISGYATAIDPGGSADVELRHNNGFRTENRGTGQITSGNTQSADIAHGLDYTPDQNDFSLTPRGDLGAATHAWVSNIDGTNFRINSDADPGATAEWKWDVKRNV